MAERLRFGVMGAGFVADRAMIPAITASRRATAVAVASRDPVRAAALAQRHGVGVAHASYDALLADERVDAVYIALHNSAHLEWTCRSLLAGKHVLCEKPLGVTAKEVQVMIEASRRSGCALMEAFMYRFHPRVQELHRASEGVRFCAASFGFSLAQQDNYRLQPELGGGALLDVGCYTLDVVRWFLGDALEVRAVAHIDGVDRTVAAAMSFEGGATAVTWASVESMEMQELSVVDANGACRVAAPFTSWHDPHDPYQLMVDAFAAAVVDGGPVPHSPSESLGTARLVDRVRDAAAIPLPEPAR